MGVKVLECEYSRFYEGGRCWCMPPEEIAEGIVNQGHVCKVWQKKLTWDKKNCKDIKLRR